VRECKRSDLRQVCSNTFTPVRLRDLSRHQLHQLIMSDSVLQHCTTRCSCSHTHRHGDIVISDADWLITQSTAYLGDISATKSAVLMLTRFETEWITLFSLTVAVESDCETLIQSVVSHTQIRGVGSTTCVFKESLTVLISSSEPKHEVYRQ